MIENKTSTYRENFPGYMGHIPYKNEVIGKTVGSCNDHIKMLLTTEPPKEEIIRPIAYDDYSHYHRDYFNENFSKEYKLEEDRVYSNKSKEADTWINGSKYKIYPQHIPGLQSHVPGIYSSNIHGMGYSKSTAIAIKGEYCKTADVPSKERYKSSTGSSFTNPRVRSEGKI
jgi:hypothetical protein